MNYKNLFLNVTLLAIHVLGLLFAGFIFLGCSSPGNSISGNSPQNDPGQENNKPRSELLLNEIVAKNGSGDYDWIELYAKSDGISLANYAIVDNNPEHLPQPLPDVILNTGEFIVIQAIGEDDTPPDNSYFVTFKLGSSDSVFLDKGGVQVDEISWKKGQADKGFSFGRTIDGGDFFETLEPTEGFENKLSDIEEIDTIVEDKAPLRINEIVAKNSVDEFDWIELFVSGDQSVDLSDYQLADEDNEFYSLPQFTLLPGQYYRIIASTDDELEPPRVNFKLGSSGQIRLFLNNDLIDQLKWKKGDALYGFSYGRFPDASDRLAVLFPSDGTANVVADRENLIINEVVADSLDGSLDWFELLNNSDVDIPLSNYQVINGKKNAEPVSLPNVILSSGEYIVLYAAKDDPGEYFVPFELEESDELQLFFENQTVDYLKWDSSDLPRGYSYGLIGEEKKKSTTLAPSKNIANNPVTIFDKTIVDDLYIDIGEANWRNMVSNALDEVYHRANITYKGVTLKNIAVRTKGDSSLRHINTIGSERFSLKVDINEYIDEQKFLGLKKFVLQNSFNDPTYMREVIAFDLFSEFGIATPKHAYVNLFLNGKLHGLYLMVEAVDKTFLKNNYELSTGDLYKPDGVGSDLKWNGSDYARYSGVKLKTNKFSTDNGALINFINELDNNKNENLIDIDNLLKYMAVSVSLSNMDSFHGVLAHNFYLYEQDGKFSIIPWDLNQAFGSSNFGCSKDIRELTIDEPTEGLFADRPLVAVPFANENNLQQYHDYLWQLINSSLSQTAFSLRVDTIADLIRNHVANDPSSLFTLEEFEQNIESTMVQNRLFGLKSFMEYRRNNMIQQLDGAIPSANDGLGYCAD